MESEFERVKKCEGSGDVSESGGEETLIDFGGTEEHFGRGTL